MLVLSDVIATGSSSRGLKHLGLCAGASVVGIDVTGLFVGLSDVDTGVGAIDGEEQDEAIHVRVTTRMIDLKGGIMRSFNERFGYLAAFSTRFHGRGISWNCSGS
jgi:hypothetical protein